MTNFVSVCQSDVVLCDRRVFALKEEGEGEWERSELCMGEESVCTDGLVGAERERHILSFGEDEEGELYILTTSFASPNTRGGVVYHLVDPSRSVEHPHTQFSKRGIVNTWFYEYGNKLFM